MIKMKDLLDQSKQTGHISNHHPGRAFDPKVDESVADDDMKAAKRLRNNLTVIIQDIDKHMSMIDKELSSFNSPGLKHAFIDALRIGTKRQGKFDMSSAKRKLDDYYKK